LKKSEPYNLKFDPGPVTLEFMKDKDYRASLLIGPFGTGKTTAAGFKKLMLQSQWIKPDRSGKRRSRFAVVRNTYPQLRDTTIRTYLDWFPPGEFGGKYVASDKQSVYRIGDRVVEILFRALDDENDVRNLLSLELSGAHIDEAREVKHSIFKGILGRVGRYPSIKDYDGDNPFLSAVQVDLTTNYPNRDHWLYRDFVSHPISGYRMFTQTQEENKHNLPPNYYENLELDYANRPDLLRTLVRGDWGITYIGKLVYPEWDGKLFRSAVPLPFEDRPFIRGWDNTGLHPACTISQINAEGQWCLLKEFWQDDIGITDFCEWVHVWCNENLNAAEFRDYCDPAGKNRDPNKVSPKDYMQKYFKSVGMKFRPLDGVQTFKTRREAVAGRLMVKRSRPMMIVDPGCTMVIDGFEGGYCYKEIGATGLFKEQPEKNKYADIHDSIQYPATKLFLPQRDRRKERNDDKDVYYR
jgi:hypothetical protein